MIKVTELPKDPIDAVVVAVGEAKEALRAFPSSTKVGQVRGSDSSRFNNVMLACVVAKKAAARVEDLDLKDIIIRACILDNDRTITELFSGFEFAIEAIITHKLDGHFLDYDDEVKFDQAELTLDEKAEIRELMTAARKLVDLSKQMKEWQRRKILHHISKIENELHKEISSFQAFVAAAGEISGLVKKVGEDAQPIAEAVQKARTITERKLEGTLLLEEEDKPKQITKAKA